MLKIVYYLTLSGRSPVEEYIEKQGDKAGALIDEAIRTFAEEFPNVEHVSIKPLKGKLWEIRVPTKGKAHRVLYAVITQDLMIVHAFTKKTQKTPPKELKLALKRLKDLLE